MFDISQRLPSSSDCHTFARLIIPHFVASLTTIVLITLGASFLARHSRKNNGMSTVFLPFAPFTRAVMPVISPCLMLGPDCKKINRCQIGAAPRMLSHSSGSNLEQRLIHTHTNAPLNFDWSMFGYPSQLGVLPWSQQLANGHSYHQFSTWKYWHHQLSKLHALKPKHQ